jgi:hypothetical protein
MATILEFRPAAGSCRAADATGGPTAAAARSAELIFFPGVRYERHEQTPAPKSRGKRRRPHDLIDLPD